MDPLLLYRIAILIIIALVYMIFDVFNRRNVPTLFAYSTIVVGAFMTLLYYPDFHTVGISILIAAVVGSVGYIFYKIGQLGAADVVELTVVSLILPIQPAAYLVSVSQFGLPFIISVFIATGIMALLMIPLYYIPRARPMLKGNLIKMVKPSDLYKGIELEHIDYWLYSRINSKIQKATAYMDRLEFRGAYTEIYYNTISEIKWYMERGGHNQVVMRELLEDATLMLTPIMPHFAEEMWHMLGNTTLVAQERWPDSSGDMINEKVEQTETIISDTLEDTNNAIALTSKMDANKGKRLKEVKIIIADDWKRTAYNLLIERKEMTTVIAEKDFGGIDKERLSKYLSQFMGKLQTLQKLPDITSDELYSGFIGSRDYIKRRLGAEVTIEKESASKSPRAQRAIPNKPSIDLAWN